MKNEILLENYYLPGQLETAIGRFVEYYNHERYHESLNNLTPTDVYNGRGRNILRMRRKIKQQTFQSCLSCRLQACLRFLHDIACERSLGTRIPECGLDFLNLGFPN